MTAPVLIIDSREQKSLHFTKLEAIPGTLQSGDYSIQGLEHLFSVERKTTSDLVGSLTSGRDRFERELHRLRGFDFARLLIVGTEADIEQHRYRSKASPRSILHSLHAFEVRYKIPVVWAGDEANAARLVERWAYWFYREQVKAFESMIANKNEAHAHC